ncbi:MAG: pilus assembly protein PilM [bacterium]|nr:pilus assembly protein PilM [bacterium]
MNLLRIFTKEKRVAGIEISDSVIRIAFWRPHKHIKDYGDSSHGDELVLIEEPIPSNLIVGGVVTDIDFLGKILRGIWINSKVNTTYAIVAIPDDKIYSKIFSFPKSVEDARLTEAMRLAIHFQLPIKTEDVYLDWEKTRGTMTTNEILLSTIPRAVADGYVSALEKSGIKTLALESHLAAIARSVRMVPKETTIFTEVKPDGATIFVLKDGILRFSRTLPFNFITEDKLPAEVSKVRLSLESEGEGNIVEADLSQADIREDYTDRIPGGTQKQKWFIALGALIRGKIPEGEDNLISLLPVGTEEAYAYQRATTFIVFMRNLIIGASLFFVIAFLATYLFMLSVAKSRSDKMSSLSATTIPQDLAKLEKKISDVNLITNAGASFLSQMPLWSEVLASVINLTPPGITISSFSSGDPKGKITLSGLARDRVTLNNYKKSLQASPLIFEVELPLTNLIQKEQLPFTVSFRFKNGERFYFNAKTP